MSANVLSMDLNKGYSLYLKALEKIQEEHIFNRWVNGYQHIAYAEFKDSIGVKAINTTQHTQKRELTETETLEKVKDILKKG